MSPVREDPDPEKDVAVTIPLAESIVIAVPTFIVVYAVNKPTVVTPLILTLPVKVAAVPVIILSVEATPVNPVPSPTKLAAVIMPLVLTDESEFNAVAIPADVAKLTPPTILYALVALVTDVIPAILSLSYF